MLVDVVLLLLGFAGVVSLLGVPIERLVPKPVDPRKLRALALIQPTVLLIVGVVAGGLLAPRLGFGAPLIESVADGADIFPVLLEQAVAGLAVSLLSAGVVVWYEHLWLRHGAAQSVLPPTPLSVRFLYGGLTEEVLARWGVMSVAAWALMGFAAEPVTTLAGWGAVLIAALLFAVGHVPVLFAATKSPPRPLLAGVVLGNLLPGIGYGWLFWRFGIEAAMLSHLATHLIALLIARFRPDAGMGAQ